MNTDDSKKNSGKEYFENLLRSMMDQKASDLHIKINMPPIFRINEVMTPLDMPKQSIELILSVIKEILSEDSYQRFSKENELDFAYSLPQVGRFRINIFVQRGTPVIVARAISLKIPKFETLSLPPVIKDFAEKDRGVVLVTGTTGSGKSTTLASLIDIINNTKPVHIISIEDPIEFLHTDKKAVINQREVGLDTKTFATALRHLLRQDPDVILIGEIRDSATMDVALSAADTGHLVFSTLHTTDARQSIERIINFFPLDQSNHVRLHLSLNLCGIICQRLLPRKDRPGMIPATEIMVNTPRIREAIAENKIYEITRYIAEGSIYGMQTFNQSLYQMVKDGFIDEEVALSSSSAPEELRMQLRGIFPSVTENKKGRELTTNIVAQTKQNLIFDNVEPVFDSANLPSDTLQNIAIPAQAQNKNGNSTNTIPQQNGKNGNAEASNPLTVSKNLSPMQIQKIIAAQAKTELASLKKTLSLKKDSENKDSEDSSQPKKKLGLF